MQPLILNQLLRNESQLLLAKSTIEQGQIQSNRDAIATYNVLESTLCDRYTRKPSRYNCEPKSKKLTKLEELVLI